MTQEHFPRISKRRQVHRNIPCHIRRTEQSEPRPAPAGQHRRLFRREGSYARNEDETPDSCRLLPSSIGLYPTWISPSECISGKSVNQPCESYPKLTEKGKSARGPELLARRS